MSSPAQVSTTAADHDPADGPVLVLCAHGTRGARGRATVGRLVDALARSRPAVPVRAAFVDVQPPAVADVVAALAREGRDVVVVPVLLSAGYHVHHDVAAAVAPWERARSTGPLGPHPLLTAVLVDRLVAAGAGTGDGVVLASAGSSDPRSAADVGQVAAALRASHDGPVVVGYGAAASPRVPEAVAGLRRECRRVLVGAYLLGPGHFHDRLAGAGADAVSAPLVQHPGGGTEPRVVEAVWSRFEEAPGRPGPPGDLSPASTPRAGPRARA